MGFLDRRERSGVRGIRTDRNRWKNHVTGDELGDTILSSIGRRDILDWLDRRKGEHQTRKNALNLLRVALQEALDRELITSNPARDVRIRATRSMAEDDLEGILSPAEQQRLLKAVPEASRPMVVFALLTGIRQAEQWWLKPEDISRSSIIIRRSSRGKAPKNGKNRTVFLLEPAQRALELARDDSDWVWPAKRGGRRPEGKAPRGWHRWVKAAKLRRRVRWHDLRHTCATSLLAGWWGRKWSLDEVCQMLGHSSVKVTERYARKLAETMRLAVAETMFPKSSPLLLPKITKTAGKMRSRLRDLNSRPAVYETSHDAGWGFVTGPRKPSAFGFVLGARSSVLFGWCPTGALEEQHRGAQVTGFHVCVALRGGKVRVPRKALHRRGRCTLPEQLRDEEVPEIVEAQPVALCAAHGALKRLIEPRLAPGLTVGSERYERPRVLPTARTRLIEQSSKRARQGDDPVVARLRRRLLPACDRAPNGKRIRTQIQIGPAKPANFAGSKPGERSEPEGKPRLR